MNKNVRDLKVGDSYWCKSSLGRVMHETIGNERYPEYHNDSIKDFNARLFCGNVFLTQKDCQLSIDYDIAVNIINNKAAELGDKLCQNGTNSVWFIDYDYFRELHATSYQGTYAFKLAFKSKEIAEAIIKSHPDECKLVLKVNE